MRISTDSHDTITAQSRARRHLIAVVAAFCIFVGWCLIAVPRDSISASEAAQHVGETVTVCGTVARARYVTTSKGQPTPDQPFTVVIWGESEEMSRRPPPK